MGERERDLEGNREDVTQENKFVGEAREGVGGGAAGRGGGREGNTIQTKQLITPGGGGGGVVGGGDGGMRAESERGF